MNQIELYGNIPPAKHAGYQETVVRFNVLGEPKRCDNLDYIPTDDEYNALLLIGKVNMVLNKYLIEATYD